MNADRMSFFADVSPSNDNIDETIIVACPIIFLQLGTKMKKKALESSRLHVNLVSEAQTFADWRLHTDVDLQVPLHYEVLRGAVERKGLALALGLIPPRTTRFCIRRSWRTFVLLGRSLGLFVAETELAVHIWCSYRCIPPPVSYYTLTSINYSCLMRGDFQLDDFRVILS